MATLTIGTKVYEGSDEHVDKIAKEYSNLAGRFSVPYQMEIRYDRPKTFTIYPEPK